MYIDERKFREALKLNREGSFRGERVMLALEGARVDAVEVVRCRACMYRILGSSTRLGVCTCPGKQVRAVTDPEGFCEQGRKRE